MAKTKKKTSKAFKPLAPGYKSQKHFNKALSRRTQAKWKPQAQAIRKEQLANRRSSKGRRKQLNRDYRWYQSELNNRANMIEGTLGGALQARDAANQTSQKNLMDALLASQGADANMAALMGSTSAPNTTNQLGSAISASQAQGSAGQTLAGILGAQATAEKARVSQANAGRLRAIQEEQENFRSKRQALRDDRLALLRTIPMLREQTRKEMIDEEIAKQSERARQRIASKSVDLDYARLSEDARQFDATHSLRVSELGINQQQFNRQFKLEKQKLRADVVGATNKAERDAAKQRQKNFNDAVSAGTEWLKSNNYGKKPKKTNPGGLFRMLRGYVGRNDALKIMRMYGGPVSKWARNRGMKRKKKDPRNPKSWQW